MGGDLGWRTIEISASHLGVGFESVAFRERKVSPKRKFLGRISRGHPGVIRADIPAQNFGQGAQILEETIIWARKSMTRRRGRPRLVRDSQKRRSEKLWAEFSFPVALDRNHFLSFSPKRKS